MSGRRVAGLALGLLGLLGLGGVAWLDHARHPERWREADEARALVGRVEAFRARTGRLPSAAELGVDREDARIQYAVVAEGRYRVWFGTSLGESYVYDSARGGFR